VFNCRHRDAAIGAVGQLTLQLPILFKQHTAMLCFTAFRDRH
jgi:hypothetical protein